MLFRSAVAAVIADLEKYGVMEQTIVVSAAANDTAGMQYAEIGRASCRERV